MAEVDPDVVLALPTRIVPVRHLRSTLILASIATLRQGDLFHDYERALPDEHKATLIGAVAATWIPLDAAQAHYAACDSLMLTPEQQVLKGRATFDGARGTLLGTAVRMATRGSGFTPWQAFALYQHFWDRGFDGGGVSVARVGPKDANVSVVQCPLLDSPYFRNGFRGLHTALVELFCSKAYITERRAAAGNLSYRVQWA